MREKVKKILVSKVTLCIISFFLGGVLFSNNNSSQSNEETEVLNQTQGYYESTEIANESIDKVDDSKDKLMNMEIGKDYTIEGSTGEYSINIEGIRFTNDRNQFSDIKAEHVVFLDFNYSNISESEETYVFSSNFKIIDEEGNILDTYPVSDNNRRSKKLPIGAKCNASEAYAMPTNSKTLKVLFYDNMFEDPTGQVEISTGL
jgi:hypothetical protein